MIWVYYYGKVRHLTMAVQTICALICQVKLKTDENNLIVSWSKPLVLLTITAEIIEELIPKRV